MVRGWKSTRSAVIRDGGMSNETEQACTHVYSHELSSKPKYTYRNWSRAEKVNHGRKTKQKRRDKQRERKRTTRGKRPFL